MTRIVADGVAVFEDPASGEKFRILPGSVDWSPSGGDEDGIGRRTVHAAKVTVETMRGDEHVIEWEAVEYPVGVLDHVTKPRSTLNCIADFDSILLADEE